MELPLYVTVLAGLLSGAAGAGLTQWLTSKREDRAALRKLLQEKHAELVQLRRDLDEYHFKLLIAATGESGTEESAQLKADTFRLVQRVLGIMVGDLLLDSSLGAVMAIRVQVQRRIEVIERQLGVPDDILDWSNSEIREDTARFERIFARRGRAASESDGVDLSSPFVRWWRKLMQRLARAHVGQPPAAVVADPGERDPRRASKLAAPAAQHAASAHELDVAASEERGDGARS